ncbi:MAG: hypothetical protein ACRCVA_13210 [Phreatobacter sp.]
MTFVIITLGAVLAAAPALYAQDSSSGSAVPQSPGMMGPGMMGMGPGMMGHGAMTGMGMSGGDMSAMMTMMASCNRMMQDMSHRPPQNPSPPSPPPVGPR